MAKTIKLKKTVEKLYPEVKYDLVLRTPAWVYYAWKDGKLCSYNISRDKEGSNYKDFQEYENKKVLVGLKNPVIVGQNNGDWIINALIIRDFGDYLGAIIADSRCLRVTDFKRSKEQASLKITHHWNSQELYEFRFYKDRRCLMVRHHVFNDGTYISYVVNPKYSFENDWEKYRGIEGKVGDFKEEQTQKYIRITDKNGQRRFLVEGEVDLKDYAYNLTKSNRHEFNASSFYAMDINRKDIRCIDASEHHDSEVMKLAKSTKEMVEKFYQGVDPEIWKLYKTKHKEGIVCMEDLVDFCACPTPEKAKKQLDKRAAAEVEFERLCSVLPWNKSGDMGMAFDRKEDQIYATVFRDGSYSNSYWAKKGIAILIFDIKKKTKKIYLKEEDKDMVMPVATLDKVKDWFNIMPITQYKEGAYRRYDEVFDLNDVQNQMEVRPSTSPFYNKPKEEIFKGTNIEAFMSCGDIPYTISFGFGSIAYDILTGQDTLHKVIWAHGNLFWNILCGDNITEQLLKQNMPYLALARLSQSGFNDVNSRGYCWNPRIDYNSKGKNLKKFFGLTINQIKEVNEFIKDHYNKYLKELKLDRNSSKIPPLVPAVAGMGKVFGVETNTIDIPTFKELLKLSDQRQGRYDWFTWKDLLDYRHLAEITNRLAPKEFINWLGKGFNLEEYNDYLGMRAKLRQISVDTNQPGLFSEKAFPVKLKEPAEVHRLHEICSKLEFEYRDAAKSRMFNNALKEAKHYEFEDKETEKEERMAAILPGSVSDLVAEGTELHHCVKNAMWIDAIAERKSVIMFIRRCSDKNTPYFTVELDPQGAIRQCHGNSNCDPDTDVIKFLGRWAEAHKGVLKQSIVSHYGALCAPRD